MDGKIVEMEEQIVKLILNGGHARSLALQAIDYAQEGFYDESDQLMKQAQEFVAKAHNSQTAFIQAELGNEKHIEISLLMIHGQDHLMNALTVIDLAEKFIMLYKNEKGGKG